MAPTPVKCMTSLIAFKRCFILFWQESAWVVGWRTPHQLAVIRFNMLELGHTLICCPFIHSLIAYIVFVYGYAHN